MQFNIKNPNKHPIQQVIGGLVTTAHNFKIDDVNAS